MAVSMLTTAAVSGAGAAAIHWDDFQAYGSQVAAVLSMAASADGDSAPLWELAYTVGRCRDGWQGGLLQHARGRRRFQEGGPEASGLGSAVAPLHTHPLPPPPPAPGCRPGAAQTWHCSWRSLRSKA